MDTPDRVSRVDGRPVDRVALDGDDPLVRAGDGLVETMRGRRGRVAFLDRHLDRIAASGRALGIPVPGADALAGEIEATLAAARGEDHRVRLCVTAAGRVWVEAVPTGPPAATPGERTAVALAGAWAPAAWIAEHKTTSRALWSWAARRAAAAGADTALLLDADGRLGESVTANVIVVTAGGARLTAPVRGLLPGVGRAVALGLDPGIVERAAGPGEWRDAREILLVGAVRGVDAVVRVDGRPVGAGVAGPVARRLAAAMRDAVG